MISNRLKLIIHDRTHRLADRLRLNENTVILIMSSVMATIVGRWYFGDIPAFEIPRYHLENALEIGPYILLGLLTGVVAVGFVKLLYGLEDTAERLPHQGLAENTAFSFLDRPDGYMVPPCVRCGV